MNHWCGSELEHLQFRRWLLFLHWQESRRSLLQLLCRLSLRRPNISNTKTPTPTIKPMNTSVSTIVGSLFHSTFLIPQVVWVYLPLPKLLITKNSMIASTPIVTISAIHDVAIPLTASLDALMAVPAVAVTPLVAANLSRISTPTPTINPTSTSTSANWYNCPTSKIIPPLC